MRWRGVGGHAWTSAPATITTTTTTFTTSTATATINCCYLPEELRGGAEVEQVDLEDELIEGHA